jgi:hypothetical protein
MKKDIYNYLNQHIGELELPDDTSEEVWEKKLAFYRVGPEEIFPPVKAAQLRQALFIQGISASRVEEAINTQEEPMKTMALIAWEYETEFKRNSDTVNLIGTAIGLNHMGIDELWKLAVTL